MAAGSSTFHTTNSGSAIDVFCSSFPVSSAKLLACRVKLPLSRIFCSSSSLVSNRPQRQSVDLSRMESKFSQSFFTREQSLDDESFSSSLLVSRIRQRQSVDLCKMESRFSESFFSSEESFNDGESDKFWTNLEIDPLGHFFLGAEGDSKWGRGSSSTLPSRDASLRFANVMWFKGSYNTEIIVSEGEPVESIIKRFRRAVSQAGVIRECQRRRYRESRQDTVKRKQQLASYNRRRKPMVEAKTAWTMNAWKLSKENLKPVDHSKKKKKPRKYPGQQRFDATKKGDSDKKIDDSDDDFWGYTTEEERPRTASNK